MKRKLLAVLLAVLMVLSILPTAIVPKTAVAETVTPHDAIEGGAILHCFNWTYNEIKAALPDIAAAGYVAVQTSPVQQGKDYDASYMDSKGQWWKLYQPLGLRIAPDVDGVPTSFLGTKEELTALCDEAEALGLYVIVDIVANHLANKTHGGYYVDGAVNLSEQVDEEYQDHPEYFHHNTDGVGDGSRYDMTQNQMGMPDLNTGNEYIQEQVYALLKECVDCGVDGFRFDAAKHIELPGDPDASSDFWSAVLNGVDNDGSIVGIRPYAGADNLFIYGESLSGSAGESWVDEFTNNYMALTDSNYGGRMRDALNQTNAGMLGDGTYVRCSNAAGNVVWVESHDTYEDGASSGIESDKIVRAWAIVGARADSTALYLARPNEIMGKASTDTAWKSPAVAAVNAFKNRYDGTREYLHQDYDNKVAWIEREGDAYHDPGVVISKLDGAGAVSLEREWMLDGYYKDEITGNVFTVSNGTITGNVGPTGVAVVYQYTDPPEKYITADKIYFIPTGWWLNDGAEFGMLLFNKDEGDEIGESQYVPLEDDDGDGVYEGEVPEPGWSGHWQYVSFMRMEPGWGWLEWDAVWNQVADLVNDPGTNCFTVIAEDGEDATGTWSYYGPITADPIYFVPTGWWLNDNARFEMWLFNDHDGTFVSLTDADGDGTYEGALPEGNWTGLNFVRMNPNGTEHDWHSKWNQTDDLVPDPGTDCFTITAGSSSGTWSVYGSGTTNPDAGYYLVGSMTGWAIVPEYKMTQTNAETEEYMIETELIRTSSYHSQVKAVYSPDGVTKQTWYPDGFDNNYGDYDGELTVSGVYKIYFRPNYDGGDNWHDHCLYAERSKYFVTVSDADKNGVVEVDKDTAAPGDTVTVTVTPHEGYELDTLVYRYETEPNTMNFESVTITDGEFEMPAYNVTVIATFKALPKPTFETQSLLLDGLIGVSFNMDLPDISGVDYSTSYMTFSVERGTCTERVDYSASRAKKSGTQAFICYVSAPMMAEPITATFHYGDGLTVKKTYTITEYFAKYDQTKEEYSEKMQTLIESVADYGYYVQAMLAKQKGWTLNNGILYDSTGKAMYKQMMKRYATSYDIDTITSAVADKGLNCDYHDADFSKINVSMVFDSATTLRLLIKPKTTETFSVTVNNGAYTPELVGGWYHVDIENIAAHQLSGTNTVVITTDNGNATITVSALSYVKLMIGRTDSETQNAMAAVYSYSVAADAVVSQGN